jgi:hypothetical protein
MNKSMLQIHAILTTTFHLYPSEIYINLWTNVIFSKKNPVKPSLAQVKLVTPRFNPGLSHRAGLNQFNLQPWCMVMVYSDNLQINRLYGHATIMLMCKYMYICILRLNMNEQATIHKQPITV